MDTLAEDTGAGYRRLSFQGFLLWLPVGAVVAALAVTLMSLAIALTWGGENGLSRGQEVARVGLLRGSVLLLLAAGVAVCAALRGGPVIGRVVPWAYALVAGILWLSVI